MNCRSPRELARRFGGAGGRAPKARTPASLSPLEAQGAEVSTGPHRGPTQAEPPSALDHTQVTPERAAKRQGSSRTRSPQGEGSKRTGAPRALGFAASLEGAALCALGIAWETWRYLDCYEWHTKRPGRRCRRVVLRCDPHPARRWTQLWLPFVGGARR